MNKINFSKILNFLTTVLPVLGVAFLNWNAFEMLFIYLSEGAIFSFFGMLKRNRIVRYVYDTDAKFKKFNSPASGWFGVVFVFVFYYFFLLTMSAMAKAIPFPKFDFTFISLLKVFSAPIIQNPQLLFLIIGTFFGNLILYFSFIKRKEFISPKNEHPEYIFGTYVLILFAIIALSFPVFWFASLIGSIFDLSSTKFINVVMAIAMVFIKTVGEKIPILKVN